MPNWKKIIVSGSDASLSSAYIEGNLTASAAYLTSASIGHLETIYETASVIYSSGSTKFGDTSDDTHEITGSLLVTGSITLIDNGTGSFGRVEATTIDLDRLSLTSTQTTVPPLQLTANSLQDGVGALRIDGSQADIFLNPSTATHTTVTFAVNNDQKLAFGMDNSTDFYITRRDGGTWYDNTFTLSRTTGKLTLAGDFQAANITGSEISASLIGTSSFAITASHALNVPDTASHALTAVTSSHTAGTASIANNATSASFAITASHLIGNTGNSGSFSGSFEGDGSALTGLTVAAFTLSSASFTSISSYTASHALNSTELTIAVYDNNNNQIIPENVRILDSSNVGLDFANSTTGKVVLTKGGHIVSGSVASASLAETASYYGGAVTSASFADSSSLSSNSDSSSVAARATTLSGDATASFADRATSASIADSISQLATASFADSSTSASQADNASSASVAARATTLSIDATASFADLAGVARNADSASVAARATTLSSDATASFADSATTASYTDGTASFADIAGTARNATTASYGLNMTASSIYVEGTASITYLESIYETSSVIYSSGSTKFGDTSDDTHEFTGSIQQSGSDSSFIGNVGIGTTSPSATLDVEGDAHIGPTGYQSYFTYSNGNNSAIIYSSTGNMEFRGTGTDYNQLFLKSGGNVGIGTTNPVRKLDVDSGTSSDIVKFGNDNGSMTFGQTTSLTSLDLATSNAYRIRQGASVPFYIKTDGNVGIGTTDPVALLHINGSGDAIRVTSTNTGAGGAQMDLLHYTTSPADNDVHGVINFGGYYSGTTSAYGSAIKSVWSDVSARKADLQFFTRDDADFSERMRIDSSGVVRVGTISAQSNATFSARRNGANIEFGHGNNSGGYYGTLGSWGSNGSSYIGFSCDNDDTLNTFTTRGSKGNIITGDTGGDLIFSQVTNANASGQTPTERMRIDSSGDLKVGVGNYDPKFYMTSTGGNGVNERFYIDGFADGGGAGYGGGFRIHTRDTVNVFHERMRITSDGNVSGSGTAQFSSLGINTAPSGVAGAILATNDVVAFASSDERLKENLEPIGSAIDKVEQLTGYTFNWIPQDDVHVYGDMKDIGVVAQEVEKVFPEIVADRENGYKAVKYEKLTAVLIEAVKELSHQNKELRKDIEELKNKRI